jgi:hypothetical protein
VLDWLWLWRPSRARASESEGHRAQACAQRFVLPCALPCAAALIIAPLSRRLKGRPEHTWHLSSECEAVRVATYLGGGGRGPRRPGSGARTSALDELPTCDMAFQRLAIQTTRSEDTEDEDGGPPTAGCRLLAAAGVRCMASGYLRPWPWLSIYYLGLQWAWVCLARTDSWA